MFDDPLKAAVDTAWKVYRSAHAGVDQADCRRCLLERHLAGKCDTREYENEELVSFGLAYLARCRGEEF
jgi:hypothetical protein